MLYCQRSHTARGQNCHCGITTHDRIQRSRKLHSGQQRQSRSLCVQSSDRSTANKQTRDKSWILQLINVCKEGLNISLHRGHMTGRRCKISVICSANFVFSLRRTFVSCRAEGLRTEPHPPDDLHRDKTGSQISPAAEKEHDSSLCRSYMRGKRLRGPMMQLVPLRGV